MHWIICITDNSIGMSASYLASYSMAVKTGFQPMDGVRKAVGYTFDRFEYEVYRP